MTWLATAAADSPPPTDWWTGIVALAGVIGGVVTVWLQKRGKKIDEATAPAPDPKAALQPQQWGEVLQLRSYVQALQHDVLVLNGVIYSQGVIMSQNGLTPPPIPTLYSTTLPPLDLG